MFGKVKYLFFGILIIAFCSLFISLLNSEKDLQKFFLYKKIEESKIDSLDKLIENNNILLKKSQSLVDSLLNCKRLPLDSIKGGNDYTDKPFTGFEMVSIIRNY